MQEVASKAVFKKHEIEIDFGMSSVKYSVRTSKNTYSASEFQSMFLVSQDHYSGIDESWVKKPTQYAGIVGDPVQDEDQVPYERDQHFFTSKEFKLGVFYAVSKALDMVHAPELCSVDLAIAFPANYMDEFDLLYSEFFENSFDVECGHSSRTVIFSGVSVIEQGAAVIYSVGLRWEEGRLKDTGFKRLIPKGNILVGCGGSNSWEWSFCKGGKLSNLETSSVFFGLLEDIKVFQKTLRKELGVNVSQSAAVQVLRDKTYNGVDLSQVVSDTVQQYFSKLKFRKDIKKCLTDIGFMDNQRGTIILAGGVILHNSDPIVNIFKDIGREVEFAYDEQNSPDSPRLAVLDGLQKFHIMKGDKK